MTAAEELAAAAVAVSRAASEVIAVVLPPPFVVEPASKVESACLKFGKPAHAAVTPTASAAPTATASIAGRLVLFTLFTSPFVPLINLAHQESSFSTQESS
ncbi:MAG: hypothetical protein H0V94_07880 [Actinobacteria bacterium]|nr:hypothetical protein [Actinomycetota bacterium]